MRGVAVKLSLVLTSPGPGFRIEPAIDVRIDEHSVSVMSPELRRHTRRVYDVGGSGSWSTVETGEVSETGRSSRRYFPRAELVAIIPTELLSVLLQDLG